MAVVIEPSPSNSNAVADREYRMPASVFLRAVEAEVFPEDSRVYLRDGRMLTKMAKKIAHAAASECVRVALTSVLPDGWSFWQENPILTNEFSAPLPDLCIVKGRALDYYQRHAVPSAGEIALVIEVADNSLAEDRTEALRDYAGAGIPIYWILNLVDWQVEVYSVPRTDRGVSSYERRVEYAVDRDVPFLLDGREVAQVPARLILPGIRRFGS